MAEEFGQTLFTRIRWHDTASLNAPAKKGPKWGLPFECRLELVVCVLLLRLCGSKELRVLDLTAAVLHMGNKNKIEENTKVGNRMSARWLKRYQRASKRLKDF